MSNLAIDEKACKQPDDNFSLCESCKRNTSGKRVQDEVSEEIFREYKHFSHGYSQQYMKDICDGYINKESK